MTTTPLLSATTTYGNGRTVCRTIHRDGQQRFVVTAWPTSDAKDRTVTEHDTERSAVAAWGGSFLTHEQVDEHAARLTQHIAKRDARSAQRRARRAAKQHEARQQVIAAWCAVLTNSNSYGPPTA